LGQAQDPVAHEAILRVKSKVFLKLRPQKSELDSDYQQPRSVL
jgi:hypothetical protein